jgi:hypothetical protein
VAVAVVWLVLVMVEDVPDVDVTIVPVVNVFVVCVVSVATVVAAAVLSHAVRRVYVSYRELALVEGVSEY